MIRMGVQMRARVLPAWFGVSLLVLASAAHADEAKNAVAEKPDEKVKQVRVIEGVGVVPSSTPKEPAPSQEPSVAEGDESKQLIMGPGLDDMQPFLQMRIVQNLQTQTAKGSTHALTAQRKLSKRLNVNFIQFDPFAWRDARNARAAVIHLLSGGHPSVGHHLLQLDPPPAIELLLLEGAIDYIEGRKHAAFEKLTPVDPLSLPPNLGGQIALVQAVLFLPNDLHNALAAIDKARLILPGTLVEEAALRRGVSIAAALHDATLLQTYAMQYARRFPNSLYYSDFRRRFGLAMRRFGENSDADTFEHLNTVIREFDLDSRRTYYLLLSYASLIAGNVDLAQQAAAAALPLTMEESGDYSRAHLYLAGSMLDADKLDEALDHLWKIKRDLMSEEDRILAERIADTLNQIRSWPKQEDGARDFGSHSLAIRPPDEEWQLDTIRNGQTLIQTTDELLFSSKAATK